MFWFPFFKMRQFYSWICLLISILSLATIGSLDKWEDLNPNPEKNGNRKWKLERRRSSKNSSNEFLWWVPTFIVLNRKKNQMTKQNYPLCTEEMYLLLTRCTRKQPDVSFRSIDSKTQSDASNKNMMELNTKAEPESALASQVSAQVVIISIVILIMLK